MAIRHEPRIEDPPAPLRPVSDLAGLAVDDVDGRPAGAVYGSLAEAESGIIRYLDVTLDRAHRHVLVPVGHARIEELAGTRRVRLRAATRDELEQIPPYEPPSHPIDSDYQRAVLAAHGRIFYGERYYAHPSFDHSGLYAGEHPIIRGDEAPTRPLPLAPLKELPAFRVAEGQPDIRGWPLVAADGAPAGTIDDLIVDPHAHNVRYALVARDAAGPALLPVGFLAIEEDRRRVRSPALSRDDIAALPTHEGPLTRLAEDRLRAHLEERLDGGRRFQRPDFRQP